MGEKPPQIRVLGEIQVLSGDRPAPLPASKKARALLGYLVVTGRPSSRERLAELLWDTPDDPRAQLRWCLWKCKPILGRGRVSHLVADRETVAFNPSGADVDLSRVRSLLAGGVEQAATAALEEAATTFRGDLARRTRPARLLRYHEWCVAERESLRGLRITVLSALVARLANAPEAALRLRPGHGWPSIRCGKTVTSRSCACSESSDGLAKRWLSMIPAAGFSRPSSEPVRPCAWNRYAPPCRERLKRSRPRGPRLWLPRDRHLRRSLWWAALTNAH